MDNYTTEDIAVDDFLTHVKYRAIFTLNSSISIVKMKYLLFIYLFSTIKITQALQYTKMWRGDLKKPQGLD